MKPLFFILAVAALVSGCGDDGNNGNGEFECTEQNTLCATLVVPDTYSGDALKLMGLLYTQVPPASAPDGILAQVTDPVIGVNRPYNFEITDITYTGDYHLVISLLMDAGRTMPLAGEDYVYWTTAPLNLDGNPLTLGEVELWLYEE